MKTNETIIENNVNNDNATNNSNNNDLIFRLRFVSNSKKIINIKVDATVCLFMLDGKLYFLFNTWFMFTFQRFICLNFM